MMEMEELAERCEAADGPDREIDAAIWVRLPEQEPHAWKHGGDKEAHARQIAGCGFIPAYTASLDAAITLVPAPWSWQANWLHPSLRNGSDVENIGVLWGRPGIPAFECIGATPALALCAAALRARATSDITRQREVEG